MRNDLVSEWAELLSFKLERSAEEIIEKGLLVNDFDNDFIELFFEDGSSCKFMCAFAIENPEQSQVAVFTEHCGYHVFFSLSVEVIETRNGNKNIVLSGGWESQT
ncbi:hypothetical protein [Vibrio parahaemolyticus]|uniref:hypothetical protein n=1 Tax=Vibrio parahaemolyticus TaxID=670 RepID=UPI0011241871|nr:hypothetical protein [Vibrio parahaemolyticus]TNY76659.1 hypothetical protein CGK62_10015 [Vibrio parahaemolyticus]